MREKLFGNEAKKSEAHNNGCASAGDFCDWVAVTDLSHTWWGTTDPNQVRVGLCDAHLPALPIRTEPIP